MISDDCDSNIEQRFYMTKILKGKNMKEKSIVYTNDRCIGCNKCIKVCSVIGACISKEENGKARIEVDGKRCVACGSCLDVCVHGAREYEDDTESFFNDLERGEPISLLVAPAFKANYPEEYEQALGGLKELGVRQIINVSFGADICTWGYLNYIEKYDFTGGISEPCPAVVSYIERYLPELIPKLFPVQSPLMCAAIYARKVMGITDRFAFISPCIAKKMEIEDPHNEGLVQYNVTFSHLMHYVREHGISGSPVHSEIGYGLGSFYPTPGGLAENVRWFLGENILIRQIEGERRLYEWMHQNAKRIRDGETSFFFIDALNCERGCICGTAAEPEKSCTDEAYCNLFQIKEHAKRKKSGDAWSASDTPKERLKQFNLQFRGLKLNDFLRGYTDRSLECRSLVPKEDELEAVFVSMNKFTKESREIDCTCCGYESCTHMAEAIYNGFNHKENCIYYEKTKVDALELEKTVAEEATKAKSAFLANMSHEIRTPINAVLGMNEMILRESAEPEILEYSENIRSAGNTLLGLVNNILDFSKIEAGKLEIEPVDYDLSTVLASLVNMIQIKADDKGLELLTKFDKGIPKYLHGDEVRIKQVITNLLTNAVKYTEKGSVTFRVWHEELSEEPNSVLICVKVEDTGIGIKPEDMKKLFSEFERIEEKRNRNIEGTGLGMNITKRLLEQMGSSLHVESVYGQGSRFGFSLKQRVVKQGELGDYQRAYHKSVMEQEGMREQFAAPDADILVVDDNEMNLMVFKNLLARTKIRIDLANDGAEALEMAQEKKYDMIFLDHMMPGLDGIETLHELRRRTGAPNEKTPAVCLTANAVSGAREKYLAEGFHDYLTKPIISSMLEELLMEHLPEEKIKLREKEKMLEDAAESEDGMVLERLKGFPWLSVEAGLKAAGSEKSYLSMLKIFYDSAEWKAQELEKLYEAGDVKGYITKVHAMKSSAKIIGALELGSEAQKLEDAGKQEDIAYLEANRAPFVESIRKIREELTAFISVSEKSTKLPMADEALMKEAYAEIHAAAQKMDCEQLEAVFERMEDYRIPQGEAPFFERLKAAADQFDYETAIRLAENAYLRKEMEQITNALEDPNDPGGALWLKQEEFSYIYRFVVRYMKRYQMAALKVLFSLDVEKDGERKEETEAFGKVLQKTLRKSDIILQTGKRQFFLLLPALLEQHLPSVVRRIMQAWGETGYQEGTELHYVVEALDYRKEEKMSI